MPWGGIRLCAFADDEHVIGRAQPPNHDNAMQTHPPLFPSRLMKALRYKFSEQVGRSRITMNDVRKIIEDGLEAKVVLRMAFQKVHARALLKGSREERFAVRKMMSRYWSNSSMFALDLVGAVIRQGNLHREDARHRLVTLPCRLLDYGAITYQVRSLLHHT